MTTRPTLAGARGAAWRARKRRLKAIAAELRKREDCIFRREFDERVCNSCALRWSIDDDQPPCPKGTK